LIHFMARDPGHGGGTSRDGKADRSWLSLAAIRDARKGHRAIAVDRGEHNEYVPGDLPGISTREIERLTEREIVYHL